MTRARALAASHQDGYRELASRASHLAASVIESPFGFGGLDRQPLLRERFWLPDPQRAAVEGGWWLERLRVDSRRVPVWAEIVDPDGTVRLEVFVVPPRDTLSLVSFFDQHLVYAQVFLEVDERLVATASAGSEELDTWCESYTYDEHGRVVGIHEHGLVFSPAWESGPGDERDLVVTYAEGNTVDRIVVSHDGTTVYARSELDPHQAASALAQVIAREWPAWVPVVGGPVARVSLLFDEQSGVAPFAVLTIDHGGDEQLEIVTPPPGFDCCAIVGLPSKFELDQQARLAGMRSPEEDVAVSVRAQLLTAGTWPFSRTPDFEVVVEPRAESDVWARA